MGMLMFLVGRTDWSWGDILKLAAVAAGVYIIAKLWPVKPNTED